jgi:hypothetical protein
MYLYAIAHKQISQDLSLEESSITWSYFRVITLSTLDIFYCEKLFRGFFPRKNSSRGKPLDSHYSIGNYFATETKEKVELAN